MQRRSNHFKIDFHTPRFTQISESHCGPAVIQMLLANIGIEASQEAIAEAGGATQLIELHGMRVDQLAQAVKIVAPEVCFWVKEHASVDDLVALVNDHQYPVGVEWQGLFEEDEDPETGAEADDEGDDDDEDDDENGAETGDDDYGHYSIVTYTDPETKQLIIADPYKDYISKDRIFSFEEFEKRWYDFNEVLDPKTGHPKLIEDFQLLFILTPTDEKFPIELGMTKE